MFAYTAVQGTRVALEEEMVELQRRQAVLLKSLSDEEWAEVKTSTARQRAKYCSSVRKVVASKGAECCGKLRVDCFAERYTTIH